MLASEIKRRIEDWLDKNAIKISENEWKCKRCGDIIWGQGVFLPVHECYTLFKGIHGGFGKVRQIVFPYCRQCDRGIAHFADVTCMDF